MVTLTFRSGLSFWKIKTLVGLFFLLSAFSFRLKAQEFSKELDFDDPTQVHVLETQRGDRFIGRVLSIENNVLTFSFRETGTLRFEFKEIKRVYPLDKLEEDQGFVPTYLSVAPTAFNLPKGQWEYQNVNLLWNTLNYGVNDNFSVGGGFIIPIFFTLRTKWTQQLTPKTAIGIQNQHLIGLFDENPVISTFSLVGTFGTPNRFLNVNVGTFWEWASFEPFYLYVSVGGSKRFNDRIGGHLTFNTIQAEGEWAVLPTLAFQYFGKNNRISLGITAETTADFLGVFGIPVLSFNQRL